MRTICESVLNLIKLGRKFYNSIEPKSPLRCKWRVVLEAVFGKRQKFSPLSWMTFLSFISFMCGMSITFHVRDKCLMIIFYCYFFIFNFKTFSIVSITISTMTLIDLCNFRRTIKREVLFKMKFVPYYEFWVE